MSDDLYQLKMVNSWMLDRITAKLPCGTRQYTMVEFNDPYVGPVRFTQSKKDFNDFFTNLTANGGGDCPELAMQGLELALMNSPPKSLIMVLTDASAKDYTNTTLVNRVHSLINSTQSQVFFLTTGLCGSIDSPDYQIYRDIASLNYGHVFAVPLSNLYEVFNYVDYFLSVPTNSSVPVFSGDFTTLNHTEVFVVNKNLSSLVITADGTVYSITVYGPNLTSLEKLMTEVWGFMLIVRKPVKGNWLINVNAGGNHSVRIEGLTGYNNTASCSKCHPNATCDDVFGALQCSCKDGFIGDGFNCTDIDECAYSWTSNCTALSSTCRNTLGSYTCICSAGFTSVGGACVDINECSNSSLNRCHSLASCINTAGGYSCVCPIGYVGDGFSCQINECLRGMCGAGYECVKNNGSYLCADPCSNYTVLNNTWRSTANLSPTTYNCDSALNGWYRFVGAGGVRMPETCIDAYRCNTHAPVWMSGSHPAVSDGVVNRTACATWTGNCCLWSSTIQVKACPASLANPTGYHVYKLVGTPASACTLSYCTGLSDMVPDVSCGLSDMKASFHKCQMKALNFQLTKATIQNSNCYTYQEDSYTNTLSVLASLQRGQCGVSSSQNATHVTYKSQLNISPESPGGMITRNDTLTVTFSCVYALDMRTSLNLALIPLVNTAVIDTGGTGQFKVSMALYSNMGLTSPYQGSQIFLSTRAVLYAGIFVEGGDTATYVLVMRNCYATPTNDSNDPLKYYIIRDSCPNTQDPTIASQENGVSRRGRFSVQMFKFLGDGLNSVYLHCAVSLCNINLAPCEPSCSGISSRISRADDKVQYLQLGPIIRSDLGIPSVPSSAGLGPDSAVYDYYRQSPRFRVRNKLGNSNLCLDQRSARLVGSSGGCSPPDDVRHYPTTSIISEFRAKILTRQGKQSPMRTHYFSNQETTTDPTLNCKPTITPQSPMRTHYFSNQETTTDPTLNCKPTITPQSPMRTHYFSNQETTTDPTLSCKPTITPQSPPRTHYFSNQETTTDPTLSCKPTITPSLHREPTTSPTKKLLLTLLSPVNQNYYPPISTENPLLTPLPTDKPLLLQPRNYY
ncbi:uromodulin-like [Gastrophryne carolinensis]